MMKGQIAGLMKQAQQMQEKMKRAQEELNTMEITGCLLYTSPSPRD